MKVFVYGTLLDGESNHQWLQDSPKIGDTIISKFQMHDMGAFPALVENETSLSKIVGEVYEITDEVLKMLDRLEGFPGFYDRKLITTEFGDAWVYYNNKSKNRPVIESGDWILHIKGNDWENL
jgi:gamma-glutamylcyclotransferase (GGCT)/AIG2-like uncharacterized protein YtfP